MGRKKGIENVSDAGLEPVVNQESEQIEQLQARIAELEKIAKIKKVPETMVLTENMVLSQKLQKAGIAIHAITGGTSNVDKKKHYLITTLEKIKALVDRKKKTIVDDEEYEDLSEVKSVVPTQFPADDLEEIVKSDGGAALQKAKKRAGIGK